MVESPAQADLDQIAGMIRAAEAFASEGVKEFASADFYDFFRNGGIGTKVSPDRPVSRQELIKGLKDMESEVVVAPGQK